MKLIIGLGNPGNEYRNNRHNVGYMFIQRMINDQSSMINSQIKVLETDCFMNESGKFVVEKVNFYKVKPEDLIIVHDDLDLTLGEFKINFAKGPQIHNGILDIENALGTKDFWRVRIGTDSRVRGEEKLGDSGHDFVLDDFSKDEMNELDKLFPEILKRLKGQI